MELFKGLIGETVVILGHHNADPDAIGAAVGVKALIQSEFPSAKVHVVMPKDISALSMKLIERLELDISESYSGTIETVIVVDTGSLNQLGFWEQKIGDAKSLVVIDHHSRNESIEELAEVYINEPGVSSTSEIVYGILKDHQINIPEKVSMVLLAGIIFDTKFLSIGGSSTFRAVSGLLENIGDISRVKELFSSTYSMPEKIARLKAAQRMSYRKVNDWVVALSELGSYQSSGARALISLGADIAIVSGHGKNETRASLRSTTLFYEKTGVHLGNILTDISQIIEGDGSGHPTAAGFNGSCSIDEFTSVLMTHLEEAISATG